MRQAIAYFNRTSPALLALLGYFNYPTMPALALPIPEPDKDRSQTETIPIICSACGGNTKGFRNNWRQRSGITTLAISLAKGKSGSRSFNPSRSSFDNSRLRARGTLRGPRQFIMLISRQDARSLKNHTGLPTESRIRFVPEPSNARVGAYP